MGRMWYNNSDCSSQRKQADGETKFSLIFFYKQNIKVYNAPAGKVGCVADASVQYALKNLSSSPAKGGIKISWT